MYVKSALSRQARPAPRRRAMGDVSAAFPASVEAWRSLVAQKAGDLPIDFLLAWIQRESAGDPCSYTSYGESGIFQLMPGQNMVAGNVTQPQLRAACTGSSQTPVRALTDDEQAIQVQSGIDYINNYARPTAHALLAAAGQDWDESDPSGDFWRMTKMVFNLPGVIAGGLATAASQLGRPAQTWSEFVSGLNGGYATAVANADFVGAYGAGGGSYLSSLTQSPRNLALLAGGLGLLLAITYRYTHA